jgi:RNA polymerase sigma factor (sigma-70 family)
MGGPAVARIVRLIRTLWETGTVAGLDDTELLSCFLRHDAIAEAAFAALVHRYAPMVFRVCRDVTGDPHDAEDAAQATFLILAKKARFIRRHDALANWLFGTARRVAARARRDSIRRRRHERKYAETVARPRHSDSTGRKQALDSAALYEELDRLPTRYRVPIVMCDLEGLTHQQAAIASGCPERTLETRLYRGRDRLRQRLIRRGVMPAAGLSADALGTEAGEFAVPSAWMKSTVACALDLVRGRSVGIVASTTVHSLLRGTSRAMLLNRLTWTTVLTIVTGICTGLTYGLAGIMPAADPRFTVESTAISRTSAGQGAARPQTKNGKAGDTKSQAASADVEKSPPLTVRITVSGRATDAAGRSVSGAIIYLVSTGQTDAHLGTTTTAANGTYTFRDAQLPISRGEENTPSQGAFQVFGKAPGYGFAWHGMRQFMPGLRPADLRVAGEDYSIYEGEPLVMDLRFAPAAVMSGRILDENGRPVSGAKVRLVSCDYLDYERKESHHNFREFWAIGQAPGELTTAKTEPNGRFRLEGVPKEVGIWVFVEHPDYARLSLHTATTTRPTTAFDYPLGRIAGKERPSVQTGDLNVTVHSTREIALRTVFASTGRPARRIRVTASQGDSANGYGANGETDADGELLFRLPPGRYDFRADPAIGGADCVRTLSAFRVADAPAQQSLELRVNEGCVVLLEAIDAKTGKGIPGVVFMQDLDGQNQGRAQVQSRTGYIDNPRSDASGRLRAVVYPGEGVFSIGWIPASAGYRDNTEQKSVNLVAGQTVTVRFEFDK